MVVSALKQQFPLKILQGASIISNFLKYLFESLNQNKSSMTVAESSKDVNPGLSVELKITRRRHSDCLQSLNYTLILRSDHSLQFFL